MRRFRIFTIALVGSIVPCSVLPQQQSPTVVPIGKDLPAWNYGIAAEVIRHPPSNACLPEPIQGSLVGLQLLAWRVFDLTDGRRDEALWWGYFLTPDGPAWLLAMTFREETGKQANSWTFSRRSPYGPCGRPIYQRFSSPPGNADVVEFFRTSGAAEVMQLARGVSPGDWFHPAVLPGSRITLRRAVVRAEAWQLAFGNPPPPDFQQ